MSVKFEEHSEEVKSAMQDACIAWLHETAGEIRSQAQRNTRVDSGKTKGSWDYIVDDEAEKADIGSPEENAIWEEFGTGEYAVEGNGRKGGWYVPADKLSAQAKSKMARGKTTMHGQDFYFTRGKRPTRALKKAFSAVKPKAKEALVQLLRETFND